MKIVRNDSFLKYANVGYQIAIALAIGIALGYYGDKKFGTFPILFIIGVLIGAAAGILNVYRAAFPVDEKKDEKQNVP